MKTYTAEDSSTVYEADDGNLYRTEAEAALANVAYWDSNIRALITGGSSVMQSDWTLGKLVDAVPQYRSAAEQLHAALTAALDQGAPQ